MCVSRCDDQVMVVVLQFRQLVRQKPGVMIIDQGDTADYESIRIFYGCGNQTIAYQVTEGFGTIGVALAGDEAVKAGQEIGINSDARPCQLSHKFLLIIISSLR